MSQNESKTSDVSQPNEQIRGGEDINQLDDWTEDDAEIPAGVTDTMLTAIDFLEDNEGAQIYNIALGEGSVPLSIFRDKYSEELAYPEIFIGQKRPENDDRLVNIHYSDICKSELRESDRRTAMCIKNIFFKAKKIANEDSFGEITSSFEKMQGNPQEFHGSPPNFEQAKNIYICNY